MFKSTRTQRLAIALVAVVVVAAVMATTAHGHSVSGGGADAAAAGVVYPQQRRMQPHLVTSWIQSQQQQQLQQPAEQSHRTASPRIYAAEYGPPPTPPAVSLSAAAAYAAVDAAAVAVTVAARRLQASQTPLASVVEDWSLVCKELCGAGLGGVPCAVRCTEADMAAAANAPTLILPNSKDLICRDLCAMQLGDANCGCDGAVGADNTIAAAAADASGVCHAFCVHNNNITPSGCSVCTATDNDDVHAAVAAPGDAGVSTTTPDWNELCESLCKTGDGGSLCNCDLSPFKK